MPTHINRAASDDDGPIRPGAGLWSASFAAIAVIAQLSGVVAPGVRSWGLYGASCGCLAVVIAFAAWARGRSGRRLSPWIALLVPVGDLVALGLLFAAQGYVATGLGVVLVLPIAWVALLHRPRESLIVMALDLVLVALLSRAAHDATAVLARRTVLWGLSGVGIVLAGYRVRTWLTGIVEEREEALRQAQILTAAARELNASLDPGEVIAAGLALAADIATPPGELARRANYCRFAGDRVLLDAEYDGAGVWLGASWPLSEHAGLAQVVATDVAYAGVLDASTLGPSVLPLARAQGVAHAGWVPVHADGELHGILAIAGRNAPISPQHLAGAAAIVEILELALANALRHERSLHAADTDPLTSLCNRRGLERQVADRRGRRPFAVLAVDVDRLKTVNDRYGHAAGDRLLRDVGATIGSVLRAGDVVARIGGDEFACVLFDSDGAAALRAAQRMIGALEDLDAVDGTPAVSIGVALAQPLDTLEASMACADGAMYRAKQAGGMRFAVAGDESAAELV